ncbi:MAG: ribosome maturation factor RimP [Gemmatimonadetes bacterium]|nr:ribosome maturation factor RimP [Gemmatimonadota bacterium]
MNSGLQVVVQQAVEGLGYEFVDIRVGGGRARPVLDVRIDRLDGTKVQVGDCESVSRAIEAVLDAAPGLIDGRYVLEVSSPGLDRPLRSLPDWRRFVGRRATVKSARFAAVGGHVEVEILSASDHDADARVTVRDSNGTEHDLALAEIEQARLAVHWQT